ncbi:hypothetical protein IWZ01DRAFT_482835 [Phyllosticta capitalensis]
MSLPYLCPPCRRNALRKLYSLRRLNRIPYDNHGSYATLTTAVPEYQRTPLESPGPNDDELLPTKPPRAVTTSNNPYSANGIGQDKWLLEGRQKEHIPRPQPQKPPARTSELAFGGWFAAPHQLVTESLEVDARRIIRRPAESPEESLSVRFDQILKNPACTTADAWQYFEHVYSSWDCQALSRPTFSDLLKLRDGAVFKSLLWAILDDWILGKLEPGLPTPHQLIERFASLGILHPSALCEIIGELNLILLKSFACEHPRPQHVPTNQLLSDLMALWARCFQLAGWKPRTQLQSPEMWSALPDMVPESFEKSGTLSSYFISRLIEHLPGIPRTLASGLSMHALITLDLLIREDNPLSLTQETRLKHQPFTDFLFRLLPLATIRILKEKMQHVLTTQDITTQEISKIVKNIESYHLTSVSLVQTSGKELDENGNEVSKAEILERFFMGRIRRALVDEQSYSRVHHLWQEARILFSGNRCKSQTLRVPACICNLTIEALTALRQPDKAVDVWNEMVDSGIEPTIKTWTGILNGCRKARDVEGLEEVWDRMVAAGVEPDEMAWTTRITGLMEGKRPDKAMLALERMGQDWIAESERLENPERSLPDSEDERMPLKPTIGMLNGVITSINKSSKDADIPKSKIWPLVNRALRWGQSLGISPDVVTFNAIISLCLNRGDNESAMFYLQQMEINGVFPDLATFSVILIWMFRGRAIATGEGLQIDDIEGILDQLNKRGLTPNRYTYGIIIDGLLNSHSTAAANAVLDYMSDHKVPLHPHIYTTFMNHFFRQRDLPSVDSLWTRIEREAPLLDIVFYDCMIKNYARLNDIGKMMMFVMRMSKHGQTPSWEAMTMVVRTLAEAEEWDRFDRVVEDMRTESGIANQGVRLTREAVRAKFWRTVYTLDACRPAHRQIWDTLHDSRTFTQYGREMTPPPA